MGGKDGHLHTKIFKKRDYIMGIDDLEFQQLIIAKQASNGIRVNDLEGKDRKDKKIQLG